MEHKFLGNDAVEFKFSDEGKFSGYASVYGNVDLGGDIILPGAYDETLKNRPQPIRMFYNHSQSWPIGKWLTFESDAKGLRVEGELTPGNSVANDVKASMRHGTLDGLSIGYRIPSGGSEKDGKLRRLKKIHLVEISVVTEPMDQHARVDQESIKSVIDTLDSLSQIEDFLRDVGGFSRTAAKTFISHVKNLNVRDAQEDELTKAIEAIKTFSWKQ